MRNCLNCIYRTLVINEGFEFYCRLSKKVIKQVYDETTCPHMGGNNEESH
ncbi:hypothetical protein [Clostridium perfringens]